MVEAPSSSASSEKQTTSEEPLAKRQKTSHGDGGNDNNDSDDEELERSALDSSRRKVADPQLEDMYMDTIDKKQLDFDLEKLCSVSLANNNVYACLTCGKYYQGRGKTSHAYLHSVDMDHHVFMNVDTLRVYALPDGYEIKSPKSDTLESIRRVANPVYTKEKVSQLDKEFKESIDLWKRPFHPGFVGLNNLKQSDYANVVFQTIAHVKPLRNYLLLESPKSDLAARTSMLVRKIWNEDAFKPHVSPTELLEHVSAVSNKKYSAMQQQDPFAFMNWFLNQLHVALGGSRSKPQSSIIHKVFQGKLKQQGKEIPFMFLVLDLPPVGLFKDEDQAKVVPQVALSELITNKFNSITRLPPYLTLHIKRFDKDHQFNPTTVNYNPRSLTIEGVTYRLVANIVIAVDATNGAKREYKVQLLDKTRDTFIEIQDLAVNRIEKELLVLGDTYIQVWERK